MRYRVIRDGETINTVELDSVWVKPSPLIAVEVQVTGSGWGGASNAPAILAASGGGQGGLKWQPPEGCTLEPIEDEPVTEPDPEAREATRLMHEAMALLSQTDFVVIKATEKDRTLSPDWLAWRDELRAIVATRAGVIREEPGRYAADAPAEPAPVEEHKFPAPDERLSDWAIPAESADDEEKQKIVTGFIDILKESKEAVEDTFRDMSADDRVKLFPLLNNELSRLTNEEALLNKPIPRRADVQSLLGILAKVGEA